MNIDLSHVNNSDLENFIEAFVEYRREVEDGGYTFDHYDKNSFQVVPGEEMAALLSAVDAAFERMTGRPYYGVKF